MRRCALVMLAAAGCLVENPAWLGPESGDPLPPGCDPLDLPGDAIEVDPQSIEDAVANASTGDTIVLRDGVYERGGRPPLVITAEGVTLRGSRDVVLDGGFATDALIVIRADDVTIADLTMRASNSNLVSLEPDGAPILRPRFYRLELSDSADYQISAEVAGAPFVDEGEIACSTFDVTDEYRATLNPCTLGAVRVNGGQGWHLHDNRITNHWCLDGTTPAGTASPAVHMTFGARDTVFERNVMRDDQRALVFGGDWTEDVEARAYADNPCTPGIYWGHIQGIIRNNTFWIGETAASTGADSMISVWNSCEVTIVHNTIVHLVDVFSAIEWRYARTSVTIGNNLMTHSLLERPDDGNPNEMTFTNVEMAELGLFVDPLQGDVHLRPTATAAIDKAVPLTPMPLSVDFESDPRDELPDIGADEFVAP
jgi:hypothetical protein